MMHIKEHGWSTLSTQCYGWTNWSCTRKGSAILSLARIPIRQFELSEFQAEPVEGLIIPFNVSANSTKTVYEHLWTLTLKNCERYRNYKFFMYEPLGIHKFLAAPGRMRSWDPFCTSGYSRVLCLVRGSMKIKDSDSFRLKLYLHSQNNNITTPCTICQKWALAELQYNNSSCKLFLIDAMCTPSCAHVVWLQRLSLYSQFQSTFIGFPAEYPVYTRRKNSYSFFSW